MSALRRPMMVVNYKSYHESSGNKAIEFTKIMEGIAEETGVNIAVAPQATDLYAVGSSTSLPLYAQHVDDCDPGAKTGHVTIEAIKNTGSVGSIVNHSEKQLTLRSVEWIIKKMRILSLNSIVCTNTPEVSVAAAMLDPTAVAVEPPELIGSGNAISRAKPEVVTNTVDLIRRQKNDVMILCGAGIISGDDVRAAIRLGADGILVASGVVKARDPRVAALELATALR